MNLSIGKVSEMRTWQVTVTMWLGESDGDGEFFVRRTFEGPNDTLVAAAIGGALAWTLIKNFFTDGPAKAIRGVAVEEVDTTIPAQSRVVRG